MKIELDSIELVVLAEGLIIAVLEVVEDDDCNVALEELGTVCDALEAGETVTEELDDAELKEVDVEVVDSVVDVAGAPMPGPSTDDWPDAEVSEKVVVWSELLKCTPALDEVVMVEVVTMDCPLELDIAEDVEEIDDAALDVEELEFDGTI